MMESKTTMSWYRQPIMWLVVGIPVSAVLFGIVMISLAITSNDGLVADDYYKRGLEINRSLERDRVAAQWGLQARVRMDDTQHKVFVDLYWPLAVDPPQQPVLSFLHATQQGRDAKLVMHSDGRGKYWGALPNLSKGRWYVRLATPDWRLQTVTQLPRSGELLLRAEKQSGNN